MVSCPVIETRSCEFAFLLKSTCTDTYEEQYYCSSVVRETWIEITNNNNYITAYSPVSCFFNSNADCSSDIKIDFFP